MTSRMLTPHVNGQPREVDVAGAAPLARTPCPPDAGTDETIPDPWRRGTCTRICRAIHRAAGP